MVQIQKETYNLCHWYVFCRYGTFQFCFIQPIGLLQISYEPNEVNMENMINSYQAVSSVNVIATKHSTAKPYTYRIKDVGTWKLCSHYWSFVRVNHWSPMSFSSHRNNAELLCYPLSWISCQPIGLWFGMPRRLTHWGRVTHICVSKLTTIGSDNGLPPGRR